MQACYPGGGARYTKHVDNTSRDGRRLRVVCYLNAGCQAAHGGCLRLHPVDGGVVEVEPAGGRLVLFHSDSMVHEVMHTARPRHALTVWYYDAHERRGRGHPPRTCATMHWRR